MRARACILAAALGCIVTAAGGDDRHSANSRQRPQQRDPLVARVQHSNDLLTQAKRQLEALAAEAQADAAGLRRDLQQLQVERARVATRLDQLARTLAALKTETSRLYASNRRRSQQLADRQRKAGAAADRRPARPTQPD